MFYSDTVLSKQGPLARIWLAAHWDKKLTKAVVFDTNLESACESVVNPSVKLALRTSGHLLLGVVRIYNRKAKYLLADCNEAFMKIKMAFRSGLVIDMPKEQENAKNQLFMPDDMDMELTIFPEISQNELQHAMLSNIARPEEITIRGEGKSLQHSGLYRDLLRDNDYGEDDFGLGCSFDDWTEGGMDTSESQIEKGRRSTSTLKKTSRLDAVQESKDEQEIDIAAELEAVGDVSGLDIFSDNPILPEPMSVSNVENHNFDDISAVHSPPPMDDEPFTPMGPPAMTPGQAPTPAAAIPPGSPMPPPMSPAGVQSVPASPMPPPMSPVAQSPGMPTPKNPVSANSSGLALQPIEPKPTPKPRVKKRRKLIVDGVMEITNSMMKAQLKDYSDIVVPIDQNYDWLAPPTVRLMHWKEYATADALFRNSFIGNKSIQKSTWLNSHHRAPGGVRPIPDKTAKPKQTTPVRLGRKPLPKTVQELPSSTPMPLPPRDSTKEIPQISNLSNIAETFDQTAEKGRDTLMPFPGANNISAVAEQSTLQKTNMEDEPMEKRARVANEPNAEPQIELSVSVNAPVENMSASINNMTAEPTIGMPEQFDGINPVSPKPMETKDAETSFTTINFKHLDDDKKRDPTMVKLIEAQLNINDNKASFFDISAGQNRKRAARQFYSLLVLRKNKIIDIVQENPVDDLELMKGENFKNSAKLLRA